jgi:4-azaleucine resistance transporter AzlC
LGYLAIGIAFGLILVDKGYPWWLALVMGLVMYAGAGQYIAVGLFAAGTALWEAVLVQLAVNARHMAYGITMLKRFQKAGPYRYYLIFALTDETFALLSSLPEGGTGGGVPGLSSEQQGLFMFYVSLLNQGYWVAGSVIGAIAGSLIPFSTEGIGFALTALFVVLMIGQMLRVRRPGVFIISALAAVLAVFLLPAAVFRGPAMKLSPAVALGFTFVMGLAIFFCRLFPFLFFREQGGGRRQGENGETGTAGNGPEAAEERGPSRRDIFLTFVEKLAPPAAMTALAFNAIAGSFTTNLREGFPVLIASALTALIHLWKRNSLFSIFGGTAIYMILERVMMR